MNNNSIVVRQLPIIEEQLQEIKAEVKNRVDQALNLVCTEETVKDVKAVRAALNKELAEWEDKRKEVKNAVMSPYETFEAVYKECISDAYKSADIELKKKIADIEDELKEQKKTKVKEYFEEYLQSKDIDFVTFEKANINVTLSASLKSLKEQGKTFIDHICDDLNLINTQTHSDEILYEYKQSLNVSTAITTVSNRYKALEEARKREEERKAREQAAKEAQAKVEEAINKTAQDEKIVNEPIAAPKVEETEKIFKTSFSVKGTRTQLKALKEFLENGGYEYECK